MIPSLNLGKLRPPPVLTSPASNSITPRSAGTNRGDYSDRSHPQGGASVHSHVFHHSHAQAPSTPIAVDSSRVNASHEVSAIRSGAVDAAEFLGCDIDKVEDVATLRKKLHEARQLFVALDAWYAARLAEKEQVVLYRLSEMASAMEQHVSATGSRRGVSPGSSGRPGISPRLYSTRTPDRQPSPSANSSRGMGGGGSYSARAKSPPVSTVVHPRPFNANPKAKPQGAPYVPSTSSPRLTMSFTSSRIPSTPQTPVSTPRGGTTGRTTGPSPMDGASSARSVGGTISSARKSQLQVVNWSSSIPSASANAAANYPPFDQVQRSPATYARATTQGSVSGGGLDEHRRAYTPRY